MLKWFLFAGGSIVWIAVCWFFGSMVALTEVGPKAVTTQEECARRQIAAAESQGRALDIMDARYHPECRAIYRDTLQRLSRPYLAKALLIGFAPVILLCLFLWFRARGAG